MFVFKTLDNKDISIDDILSLRDKNYDYELYVGTDSQNHKKIKKVLYATCIVLYKINNGGRIFLSKSLDCQVSLRQRLTNEVWKSLEVSFFIKEKYPDVPLVVDLDLNKSSKFKSGIYVNELVGMITGQNFKYRIKPFSWAASSVADRFTK